MNFRTEHKTRNVKIRRENGKFVATEIISEWRVYEPEEYPADSFEEHIEEECLDDIEFTEIEPGVWIGTEIAPHGIYGIEHEYKITKI